MSDKLFDESDPCWEGYTMVGTKTDENGNEVPRCVPDDDVPDANMAMAEESDCPDGKVEVNGDCVSVEDVGSISPSMLSAPRVHQLSDLRTEPIERNEEGSEVRYANLALLEEGVWTDQASETPTLYPEKALDDIVAEYDESEYQGPPVNTRHDLDEDTGEVNEAAVAGYVDPGSLRAEGGTLLGDVVLEVDTDAGAYADNVLQSSLESGGSRGFGGPSVELDLEPEKHIMKSDHPEAEDEITGGMLTGLGLVDRPASKTVGFGHQTASRPVAMSAEGEQTTMWLKDERMLMNADAIRDALESYGVATDDLTDEELMDMHSDMMEDSEMESHGDGMNGEDDDMEDDDEEEDENMGSYEMMDGDVAEAMRDMIQEEMDDLWGAVDELKEEMMGSEMSEELSELKEEKEELEARLSELEDEPKQPKTLADGDEQTEDAYVDAESGLVSDSAGRFGR